MGSVDLGTLSGAGLISLGGQADVVSLDIAVVTIGPKTMIDQGGSRKRLKFAGWWVLSNSTYVFDGAPLGQVVTSGFVEHDYALAIISPNSIGLTYDQFEYSLAPGTTIHFSVNYTSLIVPITDTVSSSLDGLTCHDGDAVTVNWSVSSPDVNDKLSIQDGGWTTDASFSYLSTPGTPLYTSNPGGALPGSVASSSGTFTSTIAALFGPVTSPRTLTLNYYPAGVGPPTLSGISFTLEP